MALSELQTYLLRQLFDKPLRRIGRIPPFCLDLEAQSYARISSARPADFSVEIMDKGRGALSNLGMLADIIRLDKHSSFAGEAGAMLAVAGMAILSTDRDRSSSISWTC
jgi:hypothetical protein